MMESNQIKTKKQISNWLISYTSQLVEMNSEDIDPSLPFESYGIDSTGAVGLSGDLSNWLGLPLDANLIYDHPTIDALSLHLFETFFESREMLCEPAI